MTRLSLRLAALPALLLAAGGAFAQAAPQRFVIERDIPGALKEPT